MVNNGAISLARKEFAMAKDITLTTSRASLCALGEYLKRHCFFAPLREQVQIPQKTVHDRPYPTGLYGRAGDPVGAGVPLLPQALWAHPPSSVRREALVDRCRCHPPAHRSTGGGERTHLDGAQP